jgi:DNA-binding protein HU-beta
LNKTEILAEISNVLESKKQAETVLDSMINHITQALKKGEAVTLTGFGTFKISKRNARKGRNPKTGETIKVAAKRIPKFTPSKKLNAAIN